MNEFLDHQNHSMYHGKQTTDICPTDVFNIMLPCTFLGVELFACKVFDSGEIKHGIQSLRHMVTNIRLGGSKVNWLHKDDYTRSKEKLTMHWWLKEKNAIKRNLMRQMITKDMLFLEVWEQQFPFRFEVKSFESGGT